MKLKHYPPTPNVGDTKTIIKFAWWPTRVENSLIWLEGYEEVWVYTIDRTLDPISIDYGPEFKTWKVQSIKLIAPEFPVFKNIPCPPPKPLDPDSRSLQTQIDLTKVIPDNPKMIREAFKN